MATNNNGEYSMRAGEKGHMSTFDKMPACLREAIRNHPYDLAHAAMYEQYLKLKENGTWTDEDFARSVKAMTPRCVRDSCLLAYGPDHPQSK